MLFSSITFLYVFLPITLAIHLGVMLVLQRRGKLNRALPNGMLLAASLLLYSWSESLYVFVLLTSTTIDYLCGRFLGRNPGRRSRADRAALVLSISTNLGILSFFKYLGFGISNAVALLEALGIESVPNSTLEVGLPLGISFYTFQSMSYTIDVYRRRVEPAANPIGFFAYVTMFPQLVAGPIVRYQSVQLFLTARKVTTDRIASGLRRFVFGLGKKVLIADTLAVPADQIFAATEPLPAGAAWLGLTCYTLQIYFDFSAYSDMAIGLGRMLGFHFPENFRFPYTAPSIRDFWRRWHISLSTWFRDYLYIPLGGNRGSTARTSANLLLVFLLCGLWHGASWNFVLWGLLHGAFLGLERSPAGAIIARLYRPVQHAYTLAVVMASWVLFRCETLEQAGQFFLSLGGTTNPTLAMPIRAFLEPDVLLALLVGVALSGPTVRYLTLRAAATMRRATPSVRAWLEPSWSLTTVASFLAVLFASAMVIASTTHQPFLYFRF